MTDEQKYMQLLKELGEVLLEKNNTIKMKDYQIEALTNRLSDAEKIIEKLKESK